MRAGLPTLLLVVVLFTRGPQQHQAEEDAQFSNHDRMMPSWHPSRRRARMGTLQQSPLVKDEVRSAQQQWASPVLKTAGSQPEIKVVSNISMQHFRLIFPWPSYTLQRCTTVEGRLGFRVWVVCQLY